MQKSATDLYDIIKDVYQRYPKDHPMRIKAVMTLRNYLPAIKPFDIQEEAHYLETESD
jgi:hypothetical protein